MTTTDTIRRRIEADTNPDARWASLQDLAHQMDEESREALHLELAPCDPQEFWDAYTERFADDAARVLSMVPKTADPDAVNGDPVQVCG